MIFLGILKCFSREDKMLYLPMFLILLHSKLTMIGSGKNNIPVGNYMFNVNNRNTRASCEICLKLTIKTPECNGL